METTSDPRFQDNILPSKEEDGSSMVPPNPMKVSLSEEAEKIYRTLFEKAPEGILIVDLKEGRAVDINDYLPELFKIDKKKLLEGNMLEFSPPIQPDGTSSQQKLRENLNVYRAKKTAVQFEWRFTRGNGELFDAWVTYSPLLIRDRELSALFIRDMSDTRLAEKRLEQKIKELDDKNRQLEKYIQSNLELENFAYIASHDLREPLRTIMGFSQLLNQRYQNELPDPAKEYLSMVIKAVENMNVVTMDLLEYSRVTSNEYKLEKLKPRELIKDVLTMLNGQIKERDAIIHLGSLPESIYASWSQITKVFLNLISNAIKFHHPARRPEVHIYGEESLDGASWKFSVNDNGIGIEEIYHDKIFLIFKRLHNREDYKGNGIGLAIAKKIVERHRGSISLESQLGEGTTFSFTIAK